jgi:DegV family protein with EDD domain
MSATYILTDSSVQFTRHGFQGVNFLRILPFHIKIHNEEIDLEQNFKVNQYPASLQQDDSVEVTPPSAQEFIDAILELSRVATDILVITMSGQLSSVLANVEEAARQTRGKVRMQIIDSQTTGIGLGFLVQTAVELSARGKSAADIEYQVRGRIPHIYTQLCLPCTTYLHKAGIMGFPQAVVGEMLSLMPVFSFEEGRIISVEKVRNSRHLLDNFQEFLDEFSELDTVAFMQSVPPLLTESRALKEHSALMFPKTPFSEHTINPVLAALFGPRSVGIFAIEKPDAE